MCHRAVLRSRLLQESENNFIQRWLRGLRRLISRGGQAAYHFYQRFWPRTSKRQFLLILVVANIVLYVSLPLLLSLANPAGATSESNANTQQLDALPEFSSATLNDTPAAANSNTYAVDSSQNTTVRIGVDVSEYQGSIDWPAVRANGIEFAIIRVGARGYIGGNIIADSYFQANLDGARNAGLDVGVYFFSQSVNEAEALAEADFVLGQLAGQPLDYPVVYDFETVAEVTGRGNPVTIAQRTLNAQAFCERIEAAGYTAMVYGNYLDLLRFDPQIWSSYELWFAQYWVYEPSATPFNFRIWQFASTGIINGINTYVDLDIDYNGTSERQLPSNVVIHEN